jgi:hypothetical protein
MNTLKKLIDEAQKEHANMWRVAKNSKYIGLATIEGEKGPRLTPENLVSL